MIIIKRHSFFIAFICILISFNSFSQEYSDKTLRQYNLDDGLSDSYVESIFQDSYGFLWIGTRDGLNRFDGNSFRIYKHTLGDSTSICSNYILGITEDSNTDIWCITNLRELCKYNHTQNSFKRYKIINDSINKNMGVFPSVLHFRKNGNNFIGTCSGLFKMEQSNDNYVFTQIAKTDYITSLLEDSQGDLWIGTHKGILFYKHFYQEKKYKKYPNILDSYFSARNTKINSIAEDKNGTVWITTEKEGIIAYNRKTELFKKYNIKDYKTNKSINSILKVYIDSNNYIWVTTFKNGVFIYNEYEDKFIDIFETNTTKRDAVAKATVSSIIESSDKLIWLGTHGNGFLKLVDDKSQVYHFASKEDGISHNFVSCFAQDSSGKIWIGTDGGGINMFDKDSNTFTNYSISSGLSSESVLDIKIDNNQNIWMATWGGGISVLSPKNNEIRDYQRSDTSLSTVSFNHIKSLYYDANRQVMWIGLHGTGLNIYDFKTNKFERFPYPLHRNINTEPLWINQIIKDFRGVMWFATVHGLFSIQNKGFDIYTNKPNDNNTIQSNEINTIFEDSQKRLWIGTSAGLSMLDRDKKKFIRYNQIELSNIQSIIEDNSQRLWISTKHNIYQFIPETNSTVMLSITSGQTTKYFIPRSTFKSNTGELYFGALDGFYTFHPDSIKKEQTDIPIYITDLQIFHKSRGIGVIGYRDIKPKKTDIVLNHDEAIISFEFAAMSYIEPQRSQYAYLLEGFDDNWRYIGNERKATFTNLNPGKYTFRVKSTNSNGSWNENSVFFYFEIKPPWYKTIWFAIIIVIFIFAIPLGFYLYRIYNIKNTNKKLDGLVVVRTKELEYANEQLKIKQKEVEKKNTILNQQKQMLEDVNAELIEMSDKVLLQNEQIFDQKIKLEKINLELNELNKTKDRFFSIIAHDLKNPINGLIGLSELLIDKYDSLNSKDRNNYLNYFNESSKYIYSLLINLLNWARSQSGAIKYNPKEINVQIIFDANINLLEKSMIKKNITIEKEIRTSKKIFADINMINTVIRNLLSNSIKFSLHGGSIVLIAKDKPNNKVEITIRDTGVGMSKEQIDDLFKIDSYSTTLGTDKEKGTGLGLIICKEFIEMHEGEIKVFSKQGEGTEICFTVSSGKE